MNKIIKINEREYDAEYMYDFVDNWVRNGELIEIRMGEFFWTKKHFVKLVLGLSKIIPFSDRFKIYLLAFRLQYTDLYSQWMNQKYAPITVKL